MFLVHVFPRLVFYYFPLLLVWSFALARFPDSLFHSSPRGDAVPFNQSMKPTAPFRNAFSVFATTSCRGLFLSR